LSVIQRYAVYFAPDPDSALWRFGSAVLGYDAASGLAVAQHVPAGFEPQAWRQATREPRRYGFHATLMAPFTLAQGQDEVSLVARLNALAAAGRPLSLGRGKIGVIAAEDGAGFVALMPELPPPALAALEARILEAFEPFRAALSAAERARRRPERLSPSQRTYLDRYGYPFVRDEFRFHMTLTGRLEKPEPVAASLAQGAAAAGLTGELTLDRLSLFRQDGPGSQFRILATAALGAQRGERSVILPPQLGE
jgi:hypothetical protein